MTEHDVERMLESADLSNRSKIRTSLRRSLLDRDPRRAPRGTWVLNAFALGVMTIGVIAFGVLVLGRGPNLSLGAGGQQEEAATEIPTSTPADPAAPVGVTELQPTIVPYHHTVQAGETLLAIVQQYGWEDGEIIPTVLQMNGLTSEDQITVGMTLMIPPRIIEPPFEPCPEGYYPGVPPTLVPGHEVPTSETATPFPTAIPCTPPTSAPVVGGDFGPNSAMTATPLPFDPNAPTVPPVGFMLPTPTPAQPEIQSVEEAGGFVGFEVVEMAEVPAGYELLSRTPQMFTQEMKGVTTTYIRRASAAQTYIQLKQLVPSKTLAEMAEWHGVIDATVYQDAEVNGEDALWIEGYDMGVMYSSLSQVQNILIWNTGEFSFLLTSADLSLDEMIALAEGLE